MLRADGVLGAEVAFVVGEEATVGHLFDAVGEGDDVGVVGGGDDGDALLVHEVAEEAEDGLGVAGVEFAGGFVGEDEGGGVGEGAGDRDPLLFAAGEFIGAVVGAGAEIDEAEEFLGALAAGVEAGAGDAQGDLNVLGSGEEGKQAEGLEDEADLMPADLEEALLGRPGDVLAGEGDAAAVGGGPGRR